jgi:Protein of unknown function (DUF4038)/Putative collagen-binding domain of a collagenase
MSSIAEYFMCTKIGCWAATLVLLLCVGAGAAVTPPPAIEVSKTNPHFFVKADGTPFFWQADTAWGIFSHATPQEVDLYLNDRKSKGFNVVLGVIALWDYRWRRNPDGQLPFVNGDLGKINMAFYKNVDSILDKVESRGMYMAILPFWVKNSGYMLASGDNPRKLQAYCKFLAQRYARRNVFWILGGDANAGGRSGPDVQKVTDLEAQGLIEGAKAAGVDHIMISYHPTGRQSSSFWFQDRPWLSFDSIQSGHFIETTNFRLVGDDYAKTPIKPTLDMEPGYENITDRLVRDNPNARRIKADDVRRSAYLAVFAGAAGHSYGNGEVYEFWSPSKGIAPPPWSAKLPFRQSLKLPGSSQIQYLQYLIESRPPLLRQPDNAMIVGDISNLATDRDEAMRASDGSYAFLYIQHDRPVTVKVGQLSGTTLSAWWYDPRTGKATHLQDFPTTATRQFTPPADPPGGDWVLVLDDAAKDYPPPGQH